MITMSLGSLDKPGLHPSSSTPPLLGQHHCEWKWASIVACSWLVEQRHCRLGQHNLSDALLCSGSRNWARGLELQRNKAIIIQLNLQSWSRRSAEVSVIVMCEEKKCEFQECGICELINSTSKYFNILNLLRSFSLLLLLLSL